MLPLQERFLRAHRQRHRRTVPASGQELNGIPAAHAYVGDLLTITSTRRGFAGHGLPKIIGQRLGIPGAEHVPAGSMLFMGFASSHVHGRFAGGNLPSFETIPGYTDVMVDDYFAGGTAMHLSHIGVDLDDWYAMGPRDGLHHTFHPRRTETADVLSPDQSPETSTFEQQREQDAAEHGCSATTNRSSSRLVSTTKPPPRTGRRCRAAQ